MSDLGQLATSGSADAEASVLGAILLRAELLDRIELRVDDFLDPRHAKIYGAMRALRALGRPVDGVTIPAQLGARDDAGLLSFLSGLVDRVPTADNVEHYVSIVVDHSLKRRVALVMGDVASTAARLRKTGEEVVADLRDQLSRMARPRLSGIDIAPVASRLAGEREERLAAAARMIPFEVAYLDDQLGGIMATDLVVLTARAGAGKTQLAATIAENAARAGRRALMFALEAEQREIERRMKYRAIVRELWPSVKQFLAAQRRPIPALSFGAWYRGEFDAIFGSQETAVERYLVEQLGDRLHTVYRGAQFTLDDTERVMVAMQDKVDLFVVDHLHYLDTPDEGRENEAVTAIMTRLRDLALRLKKPVLLVAHLRKEDAFRESLVPKMRDLHGSSNVSKIATVVVALAPAPHDGEKATWHLAPTYMHVLKDRRDGAMPLVAKVVFDRSAATYREFYELGRVTRSKNGGEEWERIDNLPSWAKHASPEPNGQRGMGW